MWCHIASKYIENFCVIISFAVIIFSERLADTSCQHLSLWFFCSISLAMVKIDVKNVFWRVLYSRPGLPFFFLFFYFCYSPATCYSCVLFLKQKTANSVLSFCVMLRRYMLILFQYLWISSQIKPDVTLCYHCI